MIETLVKCDVCKKPAESGQQMHHMRIDFKEHDLCEKCQGVLTALFQGTGRDIPVSFTPVGWNLQGSFQNADMAGLPGGPVYSNGNSQNLSETTTDDSELDQIIQNFITQAASSAVGNDSVRKPGGVLSRLTGLRIEPF